MGRPFVQRLSSASEFSWPDGIPAGFAQTQMRASYDDRVVGCVVDIINGVVRVERLETFDPDFEGESVALDLLSSWNRQTRVWLAAYLASLGFFISPAKISSLRNKERVQAALRCAAAAKDAQHPPAQINSPPPPQSPLRQTRTGRTIVRPQMPGE